MGDLTDVSKPYRVTFFQGSRAWFRTLDEAKHASKNGKKGTIAVWTGRSWAE